MPDPTMNHSMIHTGEIQSGERAAVATRPSGPGAIAERPERAGPPSVADLLQLAIEKGTPVAELKEIVALHERLADREAMREFNVALAAFQSECPLIKKGSTANVATKGGGSYSYTYAGLDEIATSIAPYLTKHGLSYTWDAKVEKDILTCTCVLRHNGGHSSSSSMSLPTDNASAMSPQQKYGAAMTFAQRRTLAAVLGLSMTDDDPAVKDADPTPITEDQAIQLEDLLRESKADKARFLQWIGAESVPKVRATDYERAVASLRRKAAR